MKNKFPQTSKGGVWQILLNLLYENVGKVVTNEKILDRTTHHNYARRIRELRAEGWQIEYRQKEKGYLLNSKEKLDIEHHEYVNLRLRIEVLERDNYTCQLCGFSKGEEFSDGYKVKLEVDHIIPLAQGGKTELENLQTLCSRCNAGKKSKIAYSKVNDDEVSMVVRIPKKIEEKLQKEARKRSISVKQLIVDLIRKFFSV